MWGRNLHIRGELGNVGTKRAQTFSPALSIKQNTCVNMAENDPIVVPCDQQSALPPASSGRMTSETYTAIEDAIRTAIDAANVASQNASQAGKSAREAFDKFTVARASAAEEIEELRLCADKAFDVYAQAHKFALEKESVSKAALAEFEASLRLRCERLGVEMDDL